MEPGSSLAYSSLSEGENMGDDAAACNTSCDDHSAMDCTQVEASFARNQAVTISSSPLVSTMSLNDNKAGMEGLDKDRINKIIHDASKGSKFYENEKRKEEILNAKIAEQQVLTDSITASQLQFGLNQADQLLRELEQARDLSHTIVHVDMDAFYAAVEMRDNPSLRDQPMAVGSMSMLSTSNYMARRFGIRAAMPGFIGRRLCPELVIVQPNFDKYISVSETVKQILQVYDPNFSSMSLDEAYLDFSQHLRERIRSPPSSRTFLLRTNSSGSCSTQCTCDLNLVLRPQLLQQLHLSGNSHLDSSQDLSLLLSDHAKTEHLTTCSECQKLFPSFTLKVYGVSAEEAVLEMRNRIEQRTHLTASAGIAPNTMLAKICSDKNKPNGQFTIQPIKEQVEQFILNLPVRKIPGIGKVTEKLLQALSIVTCQDLYKQRALLYHVFSAKSFHHFMNIALGIGSSTLDREGERKSLSTEETFRELSQPRDLQNKCQELCQALARDLKEERLLGKTLTLKIKTVRFEVRTRAHTLSHYANDERTIYAAAKQLLDTEIATVQPALLRLRLMGVRMTKLCAETNCSTSVASYFEKRGGDNFTWTHSTLNDSSVEKITCDDIEFKNTPATSSSHPLHSSDMFTDSCSLQQDGEEDDDGEGDDDKDFQEIVYSSTSHKITNVKTAIVGTKVMKRSQAQIHKKNNKMNKQEKIVDFLCSKQNSDTAREDDNLCSGRLVTDEKSLSGSNVLRHNLPDDMGNMNMTPADIQQVCNASMDIQKGDNKSVDIKQANNTDVGMYNINRNYVSGDSVVDTSRLSSSSDFSCRTSDTVSGVIPGDHHLLPAISPTPTGAQSQKRVENEAHQLSFSDGMIHCPVCGQQKYQWPLDQLNAHVDLCLSRSTVREILTHQQQSDQDLTARKRPRSSQIPESKLGKRSKSQHTLLSFFKL